MRLILRTRNNDDADCLLDELARFAPERVRDGVVIELQHAPAKQLSDVLNAAERCLEENEIPSVKVEVDGKGYLMTSPAN